MSDEHKIVDEGYIIYFKDKRNEEQNWKALQIFGTNQKHDEYFKTFLKTEGEPEISAVFVFHHIIGPAKFIYSWFNTLKEAKSAAEVHFNDINSSRLEDEKFGPYFEFELRKFKIEYTDETVIS